MTTNPTNILFTCAGRRNYLINYFKKELIGQGKVYAGDYQQDAPALVDADVAIPMPKITDPKYIDFLINTCKNFNISAVISLNDLELPLLANNKNKIVQSGVKVIVSDSNVIDLSFDKWKTFKFLVENNFNTPKTYINLKDALEDLKAKKLNFPLVLKPRWGSGSINIDIVEDENELLLAYQLQMIKISRTVLADTFDKNKIHEVILIQEKIFGIEYGMDILNDFNGNYFGTFAREKLLMRSGETDKAKSAIINELSLVGQKISNKLKHIGNLDCDVFLNGKDVFVLELNPRFGGGYPFSHEAGINTAAIYLEWIKGNDDVQKYNNYKENISFSKCDRLLRIN